jgi:hypothetical protein
VYLQQRKVETTGAEFGSLCLGKFRASRMPATEAPGQDRPDDDMRVTGQAHHVN